MRCVWAHAARRADAIFAVTIGLGTVVSLVALGVAQGRYYQII
jgi:hypothetical protein